MDLSEWERKGNEKRAEGEYQWREKAVNRILDGTLVGVCVSGLYIVSIGLRQKLNRCLFFIFKRQPHELQSLAAYSWNHLLTVRLWLFPL